VFDKYYLLLSSLFFNSSRIIALCAWFIPVVEYTNLKYIMSFLVKVGEDTSREHSLKTTDRVKRAGQGIQILSQALLCYR